MGRQLFQVWREGYRATGDRDGAHKMGDAVADSFEEACQAVLEGDKSFDPKRLTWWGCRLYPSEALARKQFG